MKGLEGLFRDPNDGAYERREVRTGPPLSYIAGKIHNSLKSLHRLYRKIERVVPDDLPRPPGAEGTPYSTKEDGLLSPAYSAFQNELVAFLALQNMLSLSNDPEIVERLLSYEPEEFSEWLQRVAREGSVSEDTSA